jgi:ATP-binding cassette subfamily C (CFTR/MRP) protein 1
VDQLSYADQIYVLSDGRLRQQEPHDRSVCEGMGADFVEDEGSKGLLTLGIEDKAAMTSEVNEIDDLRRATGDSAVYTYYLRYVGWTNAIIFVFFVTMNVFSSTYSRKWISHLCYSRYR